MGFRQPCIAILCTFLLCHALHAEPRPNIVFILVDDLGYGDLGCYGQQVILTPRLDRMASEGMRFTDFYAGNTVCAPSRSVLMTGQHMGHTHVRGNASGPDMSKQSLRDQDVTVAEVLKSAGYATALCGKWGLGDDAPGGRSGLPNRQGFDYFYGYLNQVHAHNYYPEFLWRNEEKVMLPNEVALAETGYGGFIGGVAREREAYSHDLFINEALDFIDQHKNRSFFLYLPLTIPHANNEADRVDWAHGMEVPDYGAYTLTDWPSEQKGMAAMITRMDAGIGQIMDALQAHNLDKDTIVIFTSDNGPHAEGGNDPDFFDSNGPLRGTKRDLYEGGIRVPTIFWGPGYVKAGETQEHIGYFGDFFATAAEWSGGSAPDNLDSISLVPVLSGSDQVQQNHEYLYWEFYERGGKQAVRKGPWKAVRVPMFTGEIQLYNLVDDIGETTDVAAQHPDRVAEMAQIMAAAHTPDERWRPRQP